MTNPGAAGAAALAKSFLQLYPEETAQHLEASPIAEVVAVLQSVPAATAARSMERLASNVAADVLTASPPGAAPRLIAAMDPTRAVAIIGWLDEEARARLLSAPDGLDPRLASELRAMAEYPPETAGRLMDPRALALRRGTTVGTALARLRSARTRHLADLFVTDEEGRLLGRVPLQDLAVTPSGEAVDTLLQPTDSVAATSGEQEVVERLTDRRVASLPVVDIDDRLVGVIRHDTLVKTALQDVAADVQAMVGASRQERALSPVLFAVRKRLPWLEINLATAFLAAAVVGLFESTIARFTALAVLLPVVAGQSGNTGAQALAVTMRGLALREIRVGQWPRVTRKEAMVAIVNGLAIALTTSAGVLLWSGSGGLALIIGVSMVLSMTMAGLAGVVIPTALTAVGQDPAQSSSIILTTVTDVVGFGSFLGIATLLVGLL